MFKAVSALQAGVVNLAVVVIQFSTLCAVLPSPGLTVRRFPHVGLRFTPDGRNLVQVRRAVVTNLAAIRYHRWSSE
jgi:hypothetical protein